MPTCLRHALLVAVVLSAACSGGGGVASVPATNSRILLTAGMVPLEPLGVDTVSADVDLARLGIHEVARAYDVSTPRDEPFAINVLARAPGSTGPVRLCIAHGADGGAAPLGGPETLGEAGIRSAGHGVDADGAWLEATGDGYVRLGLSGGIDRDQVLAICAEDDEGSSVVLLRIGVGEESIINRTGPEGPVEDGDPHVVQTATLYSIELDSIELDFVRSPAVATAGDLTTAVFYDANLEGDWNPYETRVSHDAASNTVVGGGSTPFGDPNDDIEFFFGWWRDHEVAARGNVLAVARASAQHVTLRLSFDGGATFTQSRRFVSGADYFSFRLAQVALGPSYEIALLFWRVRPNGSNDLVLVEGTPSGTGAGGEPLAYDFGGQRVLFHGGNFVAPFVSFEEGEGVPLMIGAQFSDRGDLVVAYGYTNLLDTADGTIAFTETRCLTRLAGTAEFRDSPVEHEDAVIGFDPSVSVLGDGETMTVFVAYEASDGVRLRVSRDGGLTFSEAGVAGGPGAYLPSVLARIEDGATRVDLLYLTPTERGDELHVRHWDDFGAAPSRDYRLAAAGARGEVEEGVPGEPGYVPGTYAERHVLWFGYDATLSGDDVVVVYIEEIIDYYRVLAIDDPVPGEPLLFGEDLCQCVPTSDPLRRRAVKLIRLD